MIKEIRHENSMESLLRVYDQATIRKHKGVASLPKYSRVDSSLMYYPTVSEQILFISLPGNARKDKGVLLPLAELSLLAFSPASIGTSEPFDSKPKNPSTSLSLGQARKRLNQVHWDLCENYRHFSRLEAPKGFIKIQREKFDFKESKFLICHSQPASYDRVSIEVTGQIKSVDLILFYQNEELTDGKNELSKLADVSFNSGNCITYLNFFHVPEDLVLILTTFLPESHHRVVQILEKKTQPADMNSLTSLFEDLSAFDLNYFFYVSPTESQERYGLGAYEIPNYGPLPYCGLFGIKKILLESLEKDDKTHPLFKNIQEGDWYIGYVLHRLRQKPKKFFQIIYSLDSLFGNLKKLPRYLVPRFFSKIIMMVFGAFECHVVLSKKGSMSKALTRSEFYKNLSLSCFQFVSLSESQELSQNWVIASGFPYCRTNSVRNTLIAFKGILIDGGMLKEARQVLLEFASLFRHGLIPNTYDRKSGKARYNARDTPWFFIKALHDYTSARTENYKILEEEISMKFLSDSQEEHNMFAQRNAKRTMKLYDVVQKIFEAHAKGISFLEWGAGANLDPLMDYIGFNIYLKLDETTGFIVGGNSKNCLTWMDTRANWANSTSLGSTDTPINPRDGAPVEVTALLYYSLEFVIKLYDEEFYPHQKVQTASGKKLSFLKWRELIKKNFMVYYWHPEKSFKSIDSLVTLRYPGYVKDTVKSSDEKAERWLRPNGIIALALTPDLIPLENALEYLKRFEDKLIVLFPLNFSSILLEIAKPIHWNPSSLPERKVLFLF